jgi:hypothetical protein
MGFTFDDAAAAKGEAESLATMRELIANNPRNAERIFPYIGGEEVNTHPSHAHHRYVIDFADFPLLRSAGLRSWAEMTQNEREQALSEGVVPEDFMDPVACDWPDLLEIIERRIKGKRASHSTAPWWLFERRRGELYAAVRNLDRVLAINCGACPQFGFTFLSTQNVYANTIAVVAFSNFAPFTVLQSRIHELWARFFSSTLEDRLRYAPSDCFRTFPFSANFEADPVLEAVGEAYYAFRAQLMIDRNEGLTKTYNRLHARGENGADIARLRALHAEIDAAVLRAYGWDDLADCAVPEFIEQDADEGKVAKTRLDWPAELKDEVLARLLALNAERAAAERAAGLMAIQEDDEPVYDEGDD